MIAVIADIHANVWALDAVLADIRRRGIATIVNLGDNLYGPLDPVGTAERLMNTDIISISGNADRYLHAPTEAARGSATYQFTIACLTTAHLGWLAGLSATHTIGEVLFCHGSPSDDEAYLLEDVTEHGVRLRNNAGIAALLGDASARVILCGHTHVPRVVALPDGRLIVNPGSVGVPAYEQASPLLHAMESGSPHARYSILHPDSSVEHIALAYDWAHAAGVARSHGREDYVRWLTTGRAG